MTVWDRLGWPLFCAVVWVATEMTLGRRVDRFPSVSRSLTISVAGTDSDIILHRRIWCVVPDFVVVSLLVMRRAVFVGR